MDHLKFGYDIPLMHGRNSKSASLIIGLMVFLLSLFCAAAFFINDSLDYWNAGFEHKLTVEIPATDDAGIRSKAINEVANVMQSMEPVASVNIIPDQDIARLLEPWLGADIVGNTIDLPALIDIKLKPNTEVDIIAITKFLQQIRPGIQVEKHGQWRQVSSSLVEIIKSLAIGIMLIVGFAVLLTVGMMTRSGLIVNREYIDTLRLIGAKSSYIAKQFQNQAFWVSLRGGLIGMILAFPAIYSAQWLIDYFNISGFIHIKLHSTVAIAMLFIPALLSLISMFIARVSVYRTLYKMG
jgi:cell division transport system permease protein